MKGRSYPAFFMRQLWDIFTAYTAAQRRGLLVLLALIAIVLGIKTYLHFLPARIPEIVGAQAFERDLAALDADTLIELNNATYHELLNLPQVGGTYAEKILAYRDRVGGFYSIHQLKDVHGIGPAKFAKMAPFVRTDTSLITRVPLSAIEQHIFVDSLTRVKLQADTSVAYRWPLIQQLVQNATGNDSLLPHYIAP